ncbi:MAG: hypothetical protein AUI15_23755 [Actinobacteria bacterium 13_2_20CM_2_66_6]|nr:MAG: hypothetical protein AUI15_23755 [Actinobacteria bacterium 13_2_20CM_2_66_6]
MAVDQMGVIAETDEARGVLFGDVKDTDQSGHHNRGANLFQAFAHRRLDRALIVVDKTTRQAPHPISRFDRPAAQDDAAIGFDDDRGRHLRVPPEHEVVVRTSLQRATFDLAMDQL